MSCGIYLINCLANNKKYVGSSKDIYKRWNSHKSRLKTNKHTPILQNLYNKYGFESLEFSILEECIISDLIEREQFWFNHFREKGFNMLNYGAFVENPTRGVPISEERRKYLSQVLKGKPNINKGKKMPQSFCDKISNGLRGRKMSQKNKDIFRQYILKPKSLELKKKLSDSKKKLVGVKVVCLQTGEKFDSLIDVAQKYNISYQSVRQSIIRKGKCKSLNFYYADNDLTENDINNIISTDLRKNKKNHTYNYKLQQRKIYGKKIIAEDLGITFQSIGEASEFFNVSTTTIRNYITKQERLNNSILKFI